MSVYTSQIADRDLIQKTWIPEGTDEYKTFKLITQENAWLVDFLREHFALSGLDYVLDVGGRDGQIALACQKAELVHIVDPDPTVCLLHSPGAFWNEKIQDVEDSELSSYKLIICSHVLGYLGKQAVQRLVIGKLVDCLARGGSLILFYNTNVGYMGELLEFSRSALEDGHYDYFDEKILGVYREAIEYEVKQLDISFQLVQGSFEDLARSCWFLFGAISPDIDACAAKFLPKLRHDLIEPSFVVDERVICIRRRPEGVKQ